MSFLTYWSLLVFGNTFLSLKIHFPKLEDLLTIHSNFLLQFCLDSLLAKRLARRVNKKTNKTGK